MRYILTEAQAKFLAEQNELAMLTESLNESVNLEEFKGKIRRAVLAGISIPVILGAISKCTDVMSDRIAMRRQMEEALREKKELAMRTDSLKNEQIEAIKECFNYYVKLQGKDPSSVKLSPEKMVNVCYENDFDLPLMLAQAKVESLFGLGARCQRTNSVWSIGSYDNGKNAAVYADVNDSIEPYVRVMKNDYLNGKSVADILQAGKFVNKLGKRYASDKNYENTVRQVRNAIISRYPVLAEKV